MVLASSAFQGFLKRDQRVGCMGVDTLTNYKEKRMRIVVSEYSFEFTSFSTCWRFKNQKGAQKCTFIFQYIRVDVAAKKYLHIKRIYKLTGLKKKSCIKTAGLEIHMVIQIIVVI